MIKREKVAGNSALGEAPVAGLRRMPISTEASRRDETSPYTSAAGSNTQKRSGGRSANAPARASSIRRAPNTCREPCKCRVRPKSDSSHRETRSVGGCCNESCACRPGYWSSGRCRQFGTAPSPTGNSAAGRSGPADPTNINEASALDLPPTPKTADGGPPSGRSEVNRIANFAPDAVFLTPCKQGS